MPLIAALIPALADLTVKATVILVITTGVALLMRRASAASRHVVWAGALTGVLLLPVAGVVLPRVALPVLRPVTATAAPTASPEAASHIVDPRSLVRTSVAVRPDVARDTRWLWTTVVVIAWLAGVVTFLIRSVAGTLSVRRLFTHAHVATDPRVAACVQDLACRLGIHRRVVTVVAPADWMPQAFGVVRPTIVLPSSAGTWSQERIAGVLAHELAHVARFDVVSHVVGRLTVALLWFHPLVWVAVRQARLERERACDDAVLEQGIRASRYAGDLLMLAQVLTGPSRCSLMTLAVARRSQLERRVLAILEPGLNRRGTSQRSVLAAIAIVAMALTAGATRLTAQREAPVSIADPPAGAAVVRDTARPPQPAISRRTPVGGAVGTGSPRPAAMSAAAAPEERAAQAVRAPVDFSGTWVPDDPERVQAWFEVGMARFPGSGITIAQDAKGLTLSYHFKAFRGDEDVIQVYLFDGSESTNPGRVPGLNGPVASTAKWDGDRLRISSRRGNDEWEDVYAMEGEALRFESGQSVLVFHRQGRREAGFDDGRK